MERRANLSLALVSATHGMNHFYQLLLPVVLPKIRIEYDLSYFTAGILLSSYGLSYSLFQTPVGYISGRFGKKRLLVLGLIITSLSFLAMGFTDNILVLGLLFFLAGIGGSTYHPNGMPLISDLFKENKGQASGFHQTGGSLGSFVAPLIAGFTAVALDWKTTLMVLSLPGIILSGILWGFLSDPRKTMKQQEKKKLSLRSYSSILLLIAAAAIYTSAYRGINAFANQYFVDARHLANLGEASFLFSMLQVAGLFSAPLCGRLSDRFGRKIVILILIVVQFASIYSLILAPLSILIVPCIVFGFTSFGLLAVTDAFLADITPLEHVEAIFGFHFTMSFVVGAILPPILGSIIDLYGFNLGFSLLGVAILLGIPPLTRAKRPSQKTGSEN